MANPVPAGSSECSYELEVGSTRHVPPCPSCGNGSWSTVSGGDSVVDPYPGKASCPC